MLQELCVCVPLRKQETLCSPVLCSLACPPRPSSVASLSLAGDQRSFIIGAVMAASLLTSPFKLQAPLLSINSAPPQTSYSHWEAETVFTTLFEYRKKLSMCDATVCLCVTHLYLQLLDHLHLDSALCSAAVIQGMLIVQVPRWETGKGNRVISKKLLPTNESHRN